MKPLHIVNLSARLLPDWIPIHPHRWWIHTRNVYIPMGYLYGVRFKMEENDLVLSLREVRAHLDMHLTAADFSRM